MIRVDDLQIRGYKIYQDTDFFCFGIDAVLLANFIIREEKNIKNFFDFCTGNLIIPLIVYAKVNSRMNITAIDIDKGQIELAKDSILLNKEIDDYISSDIEVINDDIKNFFIDKDRYKKYFNMYDVVSCNPPYIKYGSGVVNELSLINRAKHEESIDFETICKAASIMLKSNKNFYVVHRSERFIEISRILKQNDLEPKVVQFIHPSVSKKSNLVLIKATKGAKEGVVVMEPIVVFDEKNNYTEQVLKIYGK